MKFYSKSDGINLTSMGNREEIFPVFIPMINLIGIPTSLTGISLLNKNFELVLYHYYNQWYDHVSDTFNYWEELEESPEEVYIDNILEDQDLSCYEIYIPNTDKKYLQQHLDIGHADFYWIPKKSTTSDGQVKILPRINYFEASNRVCHYRFEKIFKNLINYNAIKTKKLFRDLTDAYPMPPGHAPVSFVKNVSDLNIIFPDYLRKLGVLKECLQFCKESPADYVEIYDKKIYIHAIHPDEAETAHKNHYIYKALVEKKETSVLSLVKDHPPKFKRRLFEATFSGVPKLNLTRYKKIT